MIVNPFPSIDTPMKEQCRAPSNLVQLTAACDLTLKIEGKKRIRGSPHNVDRKIGDLHHACVSKMLRDPLIVLGNCWPTQDGGRSFYGTINILDPMNCTTVRRGSGSLQR